MTSYGNLHYRTALFYANLARIRQKKGDYKGALSHIQSAFSSAFPEISFKDYRQNPDLRKNTVEKDLFELLKQKAYVLKEKAQAEGNREDLELSLNTYLLAQQWADTIRLRINSDKDKLDYLESIHDGFYPQALNVAWELYQEKQDQNYLEHAYYLIEKSKANLLFEHAQEQTAQALAHVNPDILREEQWIKSKLNELNRKISLALANNKQGEQLADLQNQVSKLRISYDSLITLLERDHSEYYQFKYDLAVPPIHTVRKTFLDENQAMIEYHLADGHVYILYLSQEGEPILLREECISLSEQVEKLQSGLYGWHTASILEQTAELKQVLKGRFNQAAYQLYQCLIDPITEKLGGLPLKLSIMTDGLLGNIPFDVLLQEKVSVDSSYGRYPFLIKKHQISYGYSARMWAEMQQKPAKNGDKRILAIGLDFGEGNEMANQTVEPGAKKYEFRPLKHTIPK